MDGLLGRGYLFVPDTGGSDRFLLLEWGEYPRTPNFHTAFSSPSSVLVRFSSDFASQLSLNRSIYIFFISPMFFIVLVPRSRTHKVPPLLALLALERLVAPTDDIWRSIYRDDHARTRPRYNRLPISVMPDPISAYG
jgi:hypothetical protein